MRVTDFAREVSANEGGKVNLPIAQISEVLKVANDLTNGALYKTIKSMPSRVVTPKNK